MAPSFFRIAWLDQLRHLEHHYIYGRKKTGLRAIKRKLKVQRGSRAEITNLPFAPGSEIEVIVVGADTREASGSIYDYTKALAALFQETDREDYPRVSEVSWLSGLSLMTLQAFEWIT